MTIIECKDGRGNATCYRCDFCGEDHFATGYKADRVPPENWRYDVASGDVICWKCLARIKMAFKWIMEDAKP